jgi:hypothetical protein
MAERIRYPIWLVELIERDDRKSWAVSGRGAERAAVVFRTKDTAREFQRRNPWFGSSDLGTLENPIELEQHLGKLKRSAFTHILVDPDPVGRELEFIPIDNIPRRW